MKTCSKCKVEKGEDCFVKSNRYKDGLYPSCKDCRKASKIATLAKNSLCAKCGIQPHTESHHYCYDCAREARGQSARPRYTRDSSNTTMCSKCKVNPRLSYHNYCWKCKNEDSSAWRKSKGGWKNLYTEDYRKAATARRYALWLLETGKIERGPCIFCGAPGTEFHHFDYLPKTRNFADVCESCHVDAHRFLKSMKSMMLMGARFPIDKSSLRA